VIDAYIGLGGNMGDSLDYMRRALDAIDALPDTRVAGVSRVYRSEPWGVAHQPDFANAVAVIHTSLYADQLLALLKDIESDLGRKPTERFGPRPIDLDILLLGDEEWDSDELTIPHPRMGEREFVMRPLLELDPDVRYPNGDPITDEGVRNGRVLGEVGVVPGYEDYLPAPAEEERATTYSDVPPELLKAQAGAPGEERPETPVVGWEPIGEGRTEWANFGADFDLLLAEAVLTDAEIPCEFYPHRPGGSALNPWGMAVTVRLLVPASRRAEAERLVATAMAAPPEGPDA
jgi:2-amino-4-hydroxy-6-hydroxymethyldihydropteridine diphosphokinase